MDELDDETNALTGAVIGAAIEVHTRIGPGLLESIYKKCLAYELRMRGFNVDEEVPLPITYRDLALECGYRLDLKVEDKVIVEVKCVEHWAPIHVSQMLTYLQLTGCPVGLLINFKVLVLKAGVNG